MFKGRIHVRWLPIFSLFVSVLWLTSCGSDSHSKWQAQWSDDPEKNLQLTALGGEQVVPKVATNDMGESFVAWYSNVNGNYNVRLQCLDENGTELWARNGIVISDHPSDSWVTDYGLAVDQDGHAILVFQDLRNGSSNVYAYRISPDGEFLWGENGLALSDNTDFEPSPSVAVTDENHLVFVWSRTSEVSKAVVLQKVTPDGDLLWGSGVVLQGNENEDHLSPVVTAADNDEVFLVWAKPSAESAPDHAIYAQRLDSNGSFVWNGGEPILLADPIPLYVAPRLVSDAQGGLLVGWYDTNLQSLVQHIDEDGTLLMSEEGALLSTSQETLHMQPELVFSSQWQEVFAFCKETNLGQTDSGVCGQKLSTVGERFWGEEGRPFVPWWSSEYAYPFALRGTDAGVLVFYKVDMTFLDADLRAMLITATGAFAWDDESLTLSSTASGKGDFAVSAINDGQWVVVWADDRSGSREIYAQNIHSNGELGILK
ncbi:MAG: hypothetical protein SWE60_00150 [Thermodesulfobacteriota bacterium]|nr:hypothetical protein [Thermodesulfobacteriota bacterium]